MSLQQRVDLQNIVNEELGKEPTKQQLIELAVCLEALLFNTVKQLKRHKLTQHDILRLVGESTHIRREDFQE